MLVSDSGSGYDGPITATLTSTDISSASKFTRFGISAGEFVLLVDVFSKLQFFSDMRMVI